MRLLFATLSLLLFLPGCGLVGYGGRYEMESPVYYTVTNGDTLSSISSRYGVGLHKIAMLNGLRNVNDISVGQRLFVGYQTAAARSEGGGAWSWFRRNPQTTRTNTTNIIPVPGGRLGWPTQTGRLVSEFGPRGGSFHDGIDIAAPSGTPVFASHNAKVIYSGSKLRGYGNLLILRSDDGLTSVYAHNRRILARQGERVKRGQKIAEVGATGHATGPHLHYEVRMKDNLGRYIAIDPLPLLQGRNERPRYRVNASLRPIMAGG